jgi:hypothetical protein
MREAKITSNQEGVARRCPVPKKEFDPAWTSIKVANGVRERVLRAQEVVRAVPRLSAHDGFAYALAEGHADCILLTGDGYLRTLAKTNKIEVHGFLWVIDQIHQQRLSAAKILCEALRALAADPAVRLPRREVAAYIRRYEDLR